MTSSVRPKNGKCPKGYYLAGTLSGSSMTFNDRCFRHARYWVVEKTRSKPTEPYGMTRDNDLERCQKRADRAAKEGTPGRWVWDSYEERYCYEGRASKAWARVAEASRKEVAILTRRAEEAEAKAKECKIAECRGKIGF